MVPLKDISTGTPQFVGRDAHGIGGVVLLVGVELIGRAQQALDEDLDGHGGVPQR